MADGYRGRVLKVDLTTGELDTEEPNLEFYRTYMGGRNIGAYYLLQESPPKVDPFSVESVVVFAISIITGAPLAGIPKFSVVSKSPLTGGYGEAEAGGFWACELKFAGFDAIAIRGKAESPVYLSICDGKAELRKATELWGKPVVETEDIIRKELGDERVRIVQIGPAGENLVRYASVVSESRYLAGRTGMGAVLGSKNLKAIAVRGTERKLPVAHSESIRALNTYFSKNYRNSPFLSDIHELGTASVVQGLNAEGILPTRNFKEGYFEEASKISGEELKSSLLIKGEGCFGCPVRCKRVVKGKVPYQVDSRYGGPEYETIGALGSDCAISDLAAIAKGSELCNKYGLDTISTGAMIAFAMECYENGILGSKDTNGLKLQFGNTEAMLKLIEMIVRRKGIGNILAEGPVRAAKEFGKGAEKFAMHVKGQPLPAHEPRGKGPGLAISYATAPQGADHCTAEHDIIFESNTHFLKGLYPLGILEPVDRFDIGPKKIRLYIHLERVNSLNNVLGLCNFTSAILGIWRLPHVVQIVKAVTGWETSVYELIKVGERGINLARCFNVREGFTKDDDRLPDRLYEPLIGGANAGRYIPKEDFCKALDMYYEMAGWDPETGIPKKTKLEELNIGWAQKDIPRHEINVIK